MSPLTVEQQRFTMRADVLTNISSRQRSAICGRPWPERADFGPRSLQLDRPTYAQPAALWPSPRNGLRQAATTVYLQ